MSLTKTHWSVEGDRVNATVSFSKVDRENRLVHGFATLNNVDRQGDRITEEANRSAFAKFRGNIREMHQPIAAGRLVDFKEDSFYDKETNQTYKGVYVTVYVSKGAPLTWEKVLDGTLSGFSIGGSINKAENVFDKSANGNIRVVKDYSLVELSLVDSPANQLANVFSVQKNDNGTFMKGMAVETDSRTAFWCDTDEIAKDSTEEAVDCPACGEGMTNIGWFEIVGNESAEKSLSAIVQKFTAQNSEGVKNVSEKSDEVVTSNDVAGTDEEGKLEAESGNNGEGAGPGTADDKPEETATEAVTTDEPDVEKLFNDLRDEIVKSTERTVEQNEALEKSLNEFVQKSEARFEDFEKKINDFQESSETLKSQVAEFEKSLSTLDKAAATKKSSDVEVADKVEKSDHDTGFKGVFGLSALS